MQTQTASYCTSCHALHVELSTTLLNAMPGLQLMEMAMPWQGYLVCW